MNIKRLARALIVAIAVSLMVSSAALAAEPTDSQHQAMQVKIQELKDRLALTPEQERKLAPLLQERNAKLKDLASRHSADSLRREKRAMLSEAKAIRGGFHSPDPADPHQTRCGSGKLFARKLARKHRALS